eukprot:5105671-Pyramimonas_sp.AAC.1
MSDDRDVRPMSSLQTGHPLATLARIETAVRDHPLRTTSAVEKMPRLLGPATLAGIETAVRDHPLRTPSGVEK